jgi:hypothetical protein
MKKNQPIIGWLLLFGLLIGGSIVLQSSVLYFRLIVGLGLGYTLARAYTGFAGSVNRAFRFGSTKIMRNMMLMFVLTSLTTAAFLVFAKDITTFNLWINPINFGLLAGGLLFGFGMSFSSCCASGVMADMVSDIPRAFLTLVFFGLGVFMGFPLQNTQAWIKESWFTSVTGAKFSGGVFLPDFFQWDGLNGYLGALLVTLSLVLLISYLSYLYEQQRIRQNNYKSVPSELKQVNQTTTATQTKMTSAALYDVLFCKPWTLQQGAVGLAVLFTVLMAATQAGWGASGPYGIWFGKLLLLLGVSPESIAGFTHMSARAFTAPFLSNEITVQNLGIILGALFFVLTAGLFKNSLGNFKTLKIKQGLIYCAGGFLMGFGTRLSNGCNVGALFTPIAQFSLSGWIFFIVLVGGGILGNMFIKKINKS